MPEYPQRGIDARAAVGGRWATLIALGVAATVAQALAEIRGASGTQFCSSCVAALERLLPLEADVAELGMAAAVS